MSSKVDNQPANGKLKTEESFQKAPHKPAHSVFSAEYKFRIPDSMFNQEELEELYAGDAQIVSCLASAIEKPSQSSSSFECEAWQKEDPPIRENPRRRELRTQLQLKRIERQFNLSE